MSEQVTPAETGDETSGVAPGWYRHFKGARYEVIGVGRHSETEEPYVFYRTSGTPSTNWVRPLAMFVEPVSRDGYEGPRFSRILDGDDGSAPSTDPDEGSSE